jgi:hypothetical protein
MGGGFFGYLLSILLVILAVAGLIAFVLARARMGRHEAACEPICFGSISVFFDWDENVTVIPYVKDKLGFGRATAGILHIKYPYREKTLGRAVRDAMNICRKAAPSSDSELMRALNSANWKEFSCGRRNISIHYREGSGIIFNTTRRKPDGAYEFNYHGYEAALDGSAGDEAIGRMLLGLLSRCRC